MNLTLRPYQQQIFANIRQAFRDGYRAPILAAPTGCHSAGTKILMYSGNFKNVEDIKAGDLLMGPDSKPRVVELLISGHGEMYRIMPRRGMPFIINGDHILSLRCTNENKKWGKSGTEIENISLKEYFSKTKHYKHLRKLYHVPIDFESIKNLFGDDNLPIPPYVLGILLGDGMFRRTPVLTGIDYEIIDELKQYAKNINLTCTKVKDGLERTPQFRIGSDLGCKENPLVGNLRSLGLWDTLSGTKFIPYVYKTASRKNRLEIIAGLIDTDGYIYNGCCDFCVKSKKLADDFSFVCRSLGFMVTNAIKKVSGTCYYRCSVSGDLSQIPTRVQRKKANKRKQKKNHLVSGFAVEPLGPANYYGFQLSGDGLYLLEDFTVTHNSGKTVIFSHIAEGAARRGKNILILVHRQELLLQCSRSLDSIGVSHGLVAPGHSRTADHVQVASVQTLVRRLDKVIPPQLIIIDECHHSRAGSWTKILSHFRGAKLLGVTATPCRLDGRGLGISSGGHYDMLIQGPQPAELIAAGYLTQPIIYAPPSDLNMHGVHKIGGDFNRKENAARVEKSKITGDCVAHYLKICPGQPAIAFCASIKHAQRVTEEFRAAGIVSESLDGKMSDRDRKWRIDALGGGNIQVLTSCDIISEGTDIPVVAAAILLRPTQSTGLYLQQLGRAMRPFPGKKYTIVLDHVGNVYRHGLPDIDRQWTLEGGLVTDSDKAESEAVQYYQCQSCYAVYAIHLSVCPQCGSARITKDRSPEFIDGELSPLEAQKALAEKMAEEAEHKRQYWLRRRENARAETLEDLKTIARERGYKESWAHIIWNSRLKKQRRTG